MRYIFSSEQLSQFSCDYQAKRLNFMILKPYTFIKLPLFEQLMHYSIEKYGLRSDFTEAEKVQLREILPKTTSPETGPLIWFLQFCIGEFSSDPGVWEILARSYPEHIDAFMFHAVLVGSDDVFDFVVSLKDFNAFAYQRGVHTYFSAIESSSLSKPQKQMRVKVIRELQSDLVSQSNSRALRVRPGQQEFRLGGELELPGFEGSDASSGYQLVGDTSEDARVSIVRFFQLLTWLRQKEFDEIADKLQANPALKRDLKIHESCVASLSVLCHALSVALEDDTQCEEVAVEGKPVRRLKSHNIFTQGADIQQLSYCEEGVRKTLESLTQHVVPFYQALFMRIRDSLIAEWAKRYGVKGNMETHIDEALVYALCGIDHPFAYRKDSSRLSVAKIHLTSFARQLMIRYYDELKAQHDTVFSLIDMLYENNGELLMPLQAQTSFSLLTQLVTLLSELGMYFTHCGLLKRLTGWPEESVAGWFEYATGSVDEESSAVARKLVDLQRLLTDKTINQGQLPEIYARDDLGFKLNNFTHLQGELKQDVSEAFIHVDLTRSQSADAVRGAAAGAGGDVSSTRKPSVAWLKDFLCRGQDEIIAEDLALLSNLLDAPDRLSLLQASLKALRSEGGAAIQATSLLVCDKNGRNLYRALASDPYESEWLLGVTWAREGGMIVLNDQEPAVLYSCLASTTDELRAQVDFETEQLLHAPGTINFWLGYLKRDGRYAKLLQDLLIYISNQGKLCQFKSFVDLLSVFKSSSKTRAAFVESFLEARLKAQKGLRAWPVYLKTMNLLGRSLSDEDLVQCIDLFEADSSSSISDEAYVEFFRATQSLSREVHKSLKNFSDRVLRLHGAGLSAVARRVFETISHQHSLKSDDVPLEEQFDALYQEYCQLLSECWSSECMLLLDFVARSFSGLSAHKDFAKTREAVLRACEDPLKRLRLSYLFGLRKKVIDDEFKIALHTLLSSLDFTDIDKKQETKEAVYLIRNVVDSTQADGLLKAWIDKLHIDSINSFVLLIDALDGKDISEDHLEWVLAQCKTELIRDGYWLSYVISALGGKNISVERLNQILSQCVDPLIKNGDQLSLMIISLGKENISDEHLAWVLVRCAVKPIKTLGQFLGVIEVMGVARISEIRLGLVLAKCADNLFKTGCELSSVIVALGGKNISADHLDRVLAQCETELIRDGYLLASAIRALGGHDISEDHLGWVLARCVDKPIKNRTELSSVIVALGGDDISADHLDWVLALCEDEPIKYAEELPCVIEALGGKDISATNLEWVFHRCKNKLITDGHKLSDIISELGGRNISADHLDRVLAQCETELIRDGYLLASAIRALGGKNISADHLGWALAQCDDNPIKKGAELSSVIVALGGKDISEDHLGWALAQCDDNPIKNGAELSSVIVALGGKNISADHLDWVLAQCHDNPIKNGAELSSVIVALGGKNISADHLDWVLAQCHDNPIKSLDKLLSVIRALGRKNISADHLDWVLARCDDNLINSRAELSFVICALGRKNISEDYLKWVFHRCKYRLIKDEDDFCYVIGALGGKDISADHLKWALALFDSQLTNRGIDLLVVIGRVGVGLLEKPGVAEVFLRALEPSLLPDLLSKASSPEMKERLFKLAYSIGSHKGEIDKVYTSYCRCSFFNALSRGNIKTADDMIEHADADASGASCKTLSRYNVR